MNARPSRQSWQPLLLGAGILILSHYAALLFRVQPAVSLWFPPSGVAVTLAIWFGMPAVILTGIVSTLVAPLWGNHGWSQFAGLMDSVEPFLAWWLYRQVGKRSLALDRVKDVSVFVLSAPAVACVGSAICGTLTLALIGNLPWEKVSSAIPHWWLGNAMGTMTIAPLAILTLNPVLRRWGWLSASELSPKTSPNRTSDPCNASRFRAEKIAILGMSSAIAILSVWKTSHTGFAFQQFAFLNFVPILWAALRFGAIGSIATASFCVIAALLSYILKYPNALILQNFPIDPDVLTVHKLSLLTQCVIALLTGTAITQQTQTQVKLAISQVQLAEYAARSRLTEILEQTNARLKQANREKDELLVREKTARSQAETANQVKDEFLAVVSHELRTPLNPILGWSKLLQTGKLDPATTEKALETISRNAKLQSQLIEDLLDVSRILRGKLILREIELDLSLVIRSAIETVRLSAEAKALALTFTQTNAASKVLVYGDPNRLQQVIVNLLTNAIKFTPEHGQIEVLLDCTATHVQIRVSDTGKGIHPEFLPYVFERFRQEDNGTTRNFGGLGLGLAIVRHLVELHHGQVEAKSEGLDQGATFVITLPIANANSEMLPEPIPSTPEFTPILEGRKILVIDDEADTRELLQFFLVSQHAIVISTASAQAAIAQLKTFQPDLIISDISMPEMDGYQFMRQVRQSHRIPAIALTANVREEDRLSAIAAGFDAHLAKPIVIEDLLTEIENLLDSFHSAFRE
ncbi:MULTISPECIES: hybrid sensor histidine kinase/response regulator [Leptolyngbya]|uniref:hybrid sensor histidine kinase/response regulator n=1 Tax=Leptolyngbya TaxID=47251 RepID=UPI001684BF14|nr:ATP-binding protein [Leptolyngbya sp. FACHB-1624]MBD1857672.1 MASE1 domain-containing protein [Leptolyngbya sp. FACHB-1624]